VNRIKECEKGALRAVYISNKKAFPGQEL